MDEQENKYSYDAANDNYENQWRPVEMVTQVETNNKKKAKFGLGTVFVICLTFALLVLVANVGLIYYVYENVIPQEYIKKTDLKIGQTVSSVINNDDNANNTENGKGEYTVSQIAQICMPSVVSIASTSYVTTGKNPFSQGEAYAVSGAGSGIIIGQNETELLIVTNDHVVDGTEELTVEFIDGKKYNAYIKGTSSKNDLAVVYIKISELSMETIASIKIASVGDSDTVVVGQQVVAIGNALGLGQSVNPGYVSALNRDVTTESYSMKMLQIDAPINGGNSGGALFNMYGEVIGINAAKLSSSSSSTSASIEGMGYAIPISQVKTIIDELVNKETLEKVPEAERGYLGLVVVNVSAMDSQIYSIPEGVLVNKVTEASGAYKAGVNVGDVIVAVNGEEVSTKEEMSEILAYYRAGETVELTVKVSEGRGKYTEKKFTVELKNYNQIYSE